MGWWRRSLRPDARSITRSPPLPQGGCDRYDRRMRTLLLVLGVLLVGAGAVFVAQGLDLPFAPASFMTADRTWVLIGVVVVVAGVVLVGWSRQRDPSG